MPSCGAERAVLLPIMADLSSTAAKVKTMLELDVAWEGAQRQGEIYRQRFKKTKLMGGP